jgi:hypothetical protein
MSIPVAQDEGRWAAVVTVTKFEDLTAEVIAARSAAFPASSESLKKIHIDCVPICTAGPHPAMLFSPTDTFSKLTFHVPTADVLTVPVESRPSLTPTQG